MACVILPSETARLVYGYLVKENLNDIAHQFLESSPYLMDCCQIVKSGYQFNTKLMGKDLGEMLQEYSVIHNLVNSKVSSLCKTSLLYKRIKLRCESLSEILELILFWKFKNTKTEENAPNSEKTEKNLSNIEANIQCEYSSHSDVKGSDNNSDNVFLNKSSNLNPVQKDTIFSDTLSSKLSSDSYVGSKEVFTELANSVQSQKSDYNTESNKKNRNISLCKTVEFPEDSEKNKNSSVTSENCSSTNVDSDSNHFLPESRFTSSTNIHNNKTAGNSQCQDLVGNDMPTESLVPEEESNRFESPTKIVGLQEETQSESQPLNVFSKPLGEEEGNTNLGTSSVVFVSSDVSNVALNQEQSQIIVIPFDYYKPQDSMQHDIGIENNKELGLIQSEVVNQQKNDLIFEETFKAASSSDISLFTETSTKKCAADENIMTENDFLKNGQLMFNLEKELYKPDPPQRTRVVKESKPDPPPVQASSTPVIVVPQTIPPKPCRYRTILPKKEKPVQIHPVVVFHPLLENNKDLTNPKSTAPKTSQVAKTRAEARRKIRKKNTPIQQLDSPEEENAENVNEIVQKPAVADEVTSEVPTENLDVQVPFDKQAEIERTNEEKENLEKTENKKNETPIFVTKRNSKRLSLSTPRRRSHIRALEFETPPKTNEEKKKSKTSPKVKVEPVKVERKSVRNTLFKSPIPEDTLKSPVLTKENKKLELNSKPSETSEAIEPLNELSIPIATRSPNTKLSDAWENLTGVGCVIGQSDSTKTSPNKKMWDADLRCFILDNSFEGEPSEKKRMRKQEKNQRDNRKSTKKKIVPHKRIKPIPVTVSPSKISLTAKRNTYSINGNEEGSPTRALLPDDLRIVTPFKDIETIRPTEETPLTKLLRENINNIDIDLSMINTPSFPPTPSIVITPDFDDVSMSGTNYYSPSKDFSKDKILKITDYFRVDTEKSAKKDSKEMHEKVIDDLVTKAKEIIGLGKEPQEENSLKRRPSGKILSMVKIQMLTQCDKKLMENIPINEEATFSSSNQSVVGNVVEKVTPKTDLKDELEEKRKRALKKIKVVKENLSRTRSRVTKRSRKRRRTETLSKSDKSKSDVSKDSLEDREETSDESVRKDSRVLHSTPYGKNECVKLPNSDSDKNVDDKVLEDIRQRFPPFQSDSGKYLELNEKSRKKLHYVESFLKLDEIVKFLEEFNENHSRKLVLKPSLRRFFHIFYKWLKHPHKRELNASSETNNILKEYLSLFDKINLGLNNKSKRLKKEAYAPEESGFPSSNIFGSNAGNKRGSLDDEDRSHKKKGVDKRKDEDGEDGVVSTLPLKKRKSTVQQAENKTAVEKCDLKNNSSENASQTQNFLQDIDVDRFLSQIHGQETR